MSRTYFLTGSILLAASLLWFFPVSCSTNTTPSAPVTVNQPITLLETATNSPTGSPTSTFTITLSPTSTYTPVTILSTPSFTPTGSPTATFTITLTPTSTSTPVTILVTPTPSPTFTPTFSFTLTPSDTPTITYTPTNTPTATPTNCSSFGGAGNGTNTIIGPNNTMASPFTLSTLAMMKDLRVNLTGDVTGYNVNLAIYDDASGVPGNLIIQGTPQLMTVGWNQLPLPDTPLNPGTYWLAVKGSGSNLGMVMDETTSGTLAYRLSDSWNSGNFTSHYSANYTETNNKLSVRADYCVYPGMSPVPTNTGTFTSTYTPTPTYTPTNTFTPTNTYTPTPCATNGVMGETSIAYSGSQDSASNLFFYTAFVAPATGTLRDAQLWAIADVGSTLRVLIYDNAGGQMTNLVAASAGYTFTTYTGAYQHIVLPMPAATLTSGQTYYLGAFLPSQGGGYQFVGSGSGSLGTYSVQGFVQNPASWIGSAYPSSTNSMTIYVDFCE